MKNVLIFGYITFGVIYFLLVLSLEYHERRFTFPGDPLRKWTRLIQGIMGLVFLLSLVLFFRLV